MVSNVSVSYNLVARSQGHRRLPAARRLWETAVLYGSEINTSVRILVTSHLVPTRVETTAMITALWIATAPRVADIMAQLVQ